MHCFKNGNDCPYRTICQSKTANGDCYKMCGKLNEIDTLFHNANIPRAYLQPIILYPAKEDINTYETLAEIKNNIITYVDNGITLYINSKENRNGKTSWGIKLLQNYLHHVWSEAGGRTRGLYVDVPVYFSELKAEFDTKDRTAKEFAKDIDGADLVIFDNIDSNRLSEWERSILLQHIKKRLSHGLSSIFIGRYQGIQLANILGQDLAYYIESVGQNLTLVGKRGNLR